MQARHVPVVRRHLAPATQNEHDERGPSRRLLVRPPSTSGRRSVCNSVPGGSRLEPWGSVGACPIYGIQVTSTPFEVLNPVPQGLPTGALGLRYQYW